MTQAIRLLDAQPLHTLSRLEAELNAVTRERNGLKLRHRRAVSHILDLCAEFRDLRRQHEQSLNLLGEFAAEHACTCPTGGTVYEMCRACQAIALIKQHEGDDH